MTLSEIEETGDGKPEMTMTVAGLPVIFATADALERATSDGRRIVNGLLLEGARFSAKTQPIEAQLDEGRFQIEVVDLEVVDLEEGVGEVTGAAGPVTQALAAAPSRTTWLTADLRIGDDEAFVASTGGWPESGVIHVNQEAIGYDGLSETSFLNLERGIWNTIEQAHSTGDGQELVVPRVTDTPFVFEGRRVSFHFYGEGDDFTVQGKLKWLGVLSKDVTFGKKWGTWEFEVSNLAWLLSQPVSGDLTENIGIRGIYNPAAASVTFNLTVRNGPRRGDTLAHRRQVQVSGHHETEQERCDAITAAIAEVLEPLTIAGDNVVIAEPDPQAGWRLVLVTTGTPIYIGIEAAEARLRRRRRFGDEERNLLSPIDRAEGTPDRRGELAWTSNVFEGEDVDTAVANQRYFIRINAEFPRSCFGSPLTDTFTNVDLEQTHPPFDVYISGAVAPLAGMLAVLPLSEEEDESQFQDVAFFDPVQRFIRFDFVSAGDVFEFGPDTTVRLARRLVNGGTVAELVDNIVEESPALAGVAGLPLFSPGDFTDWNPVVDRAIGGRTLGSDRVIITREEIELGDLISPELQLIGCYLALDPVGRLDVQELRLPLATDAIAAELVESNTVGDLPVLEKGAEGQIDEVVFRTGYDWQEDEHKGDNIIVRNRRGKLPNSAPRPIEIAPLSFSARTQNPQDAAPELELDDAESAAQRILAVYGGAYEYLDLEVPLDVWGRVSHGSTVLVTSPYVPNARGGYGIRRKPGVVVMFVFEPAAGMGQLRLLMHNRRLAGYAPSLPVTGVTNLGEGAWDLSVQTTGYTDRDVEEWFDLVDRPFVELLEFGTASPLRVPGLVTAALLRTVRVKVEPDVDLTGREWTLAYRRSTEVAPDQFAFSFVAGENRRLTDPAGDEVDAFEFGP